MANHSIYFVILALFAAAPATRAGFVPVASAAYVAPFASTYNAHHINHAVAYPVPPASLPVAAEPAKVDVVGATPQHFSFHAGAFAAPTRVGFAAAPVTFADRTVALTAATPVKLGLAAASHAYSHSYPHLYQQPHVAFSAPARAPLSSYYW